MIKADIVKAVATELKMNDRDALGIVDHIIEALKLVIKENERLEIRDFGVFQIKQRKARIGRNPRNKKEYPISPHKVVTFKPGKNVKLGLLTRGKAPAPVSALVVPSLAAGVSAAPPAFMAP
ncbi:MAG: integration host factor subunit beta [Candidatus Sumerlaeota bacterium]|nr:integration host factor subunit beta [Candidatus Sumerlaeota bacterium]